MQSLSGRLLELVHGLDELGKEPTLAELGHALQRVKLTAADVAEYVQPNPRCYSRVPVVVRDAYDLLVMTWMPGQASVPHDHAGSICAMQVVQGEASEGCYAPAPDGYVDLQYESTASCGEVVVGQDAGVHTVRNASSSEVLVTVHVYAPPLRDVRQYRVRPASIGAASEKAPRLQTVVIVGAGFSGAITAAQVLRQANQAGVAVQVFLTERRGAIGEGLAYSTQDPAHLLNVPAGRMSAWSDRPNDFLEWATRRDPSVKPGDFLPRQWYGEYVREALLRTADEGTPSSRLTVIFDEVRSVARHPAGGWMVHLARRASVRSDAVVLTVGHRPPSDPIARRWNGPRTRYIADPWRPFATGVVRPDEPAVVIGSGLTAVDTVLSLGEAPRRAPLVLLSRNGLVPQVHATSPVTPLDLAPLVTELAGASGGVRVRTLLGRLRDTARKLAETGGDWRSVVDGLRPHTAALWKAMSLDERRRFLNRLRPYWEVHRHRMAPHIAARFNAMVAGEELRIVGGRVESAQAESDAVRLIIRERGSERFVESKTAWVINCTGPLPSNSVESNPVIGSLLISGFLRPDELMLGIETTPRGNAIGADGEEIDDLFLVGTLRKSTDWESTAVPELRNQAREVATELVRKFQGKSPEYWL